MCGNILRTFAITTALIISTISVSAQTDDTDEGHIYSKVKTSFNLWMQKGEFEPMSDYRQRLKDESFVAFKKIYMEKVQNRINDRLKSMRLESILKYDTETEVFSVSPKWTPGRQENKPVKVTYQVPVQFKLSQ
jgi:hypothetical protein